MPENTSIQDLKFELGAAAARQQKQNRPAQLIAIAGVVFIVALILMIWSVVGRLGAESKLARQESQAKETITLAARLAQLQDAATQSEGAGKFDTITDIRSRLKTAASSSGLKAELPLPKPRTVNNPRSNAQQQRLEYEVKDESLDAIIRWIEKSQAEIPGLEVFALNLRPEANAWNCKVTFSRWEWAKGS